MLPHRRRCETIALTHAKVLLAIAHFSINGTFLLRQSNFSKESAFRLLKQNNDFVDWCCFPAALMTLIWGAKNCDALLQKSGFFQLCADFSRAFLYQMTCLKFTEGFKLSWTLTTILWHQIISKETKILTILLIVLCPFFLIKMACNWKTKKKIVENCWIHKIVVGGKPLTNWRPQAKLSRWRYVLPRPEKGSKYCLLASMWYGGLVVCQSAQHSLRETAACKCRLSGWCNRFDKSMCLL